MFHVGASVISLAPTYFMSQSALILLLLASKSQLLYPQGARRIRKVAEPPMAARSLCCDLVFGSKDKRSK